MKSIQLAAAVVLVALLAACGGGGGGSSTPNVTPTVPSGNSPTSTPGGTGATSTPSAAPTATPTTSAAGTNYTGTVISTDANNAPVSGATVSVGTGWTYQGSGYALGTVLATATTTANGSFSIFVPAAATNLQVVASGLESAHRPIQTAPNSWGVQPPAGTFGTIGLPTATSDEAAELVAFNNDRAAHANGLGKQALSLDADLTLIARAVTKNEGTLGYYSHEAPGTNYSYSGHYACTALVGAYCANPIYEQENLGAGPTETTLQMESGIVALGPGEGHYDNVMSQTNLFVGFGEYLNGVPDVNTVTSENYQAQEFWTTTPNASP